MTHEAFAALLADPDMGGCAFTYGRLVESVDAKGRARLEEEIFSARGNIQPAPGRERELLPEEDRVRDCILIFTTAPLGAGGGASVKADRVYYAGGAYRVRRAEPWREHGGFTKALAVLAKDADGLCPARTQGDTGGAAPHEEEGNVR